MKKFHYCRPETLLHTQRVSRLVEFIRSFEPDLSCFQELDQKLIEAVEPALSPRLERANFMLNESLPARDGCGIYYNSERLRIIDRRSVRFNNIVEKHLPSLTEAARRDDSVFSLTRAFDREIREKANMAVLVKFEHVYSGKSIVVCSSHLFWDPSYPDLKLLQSYLLGKEVFEFSRGSDAAVIGADLNSLPVSSGVYELLMGSGTVPTDHPDHPVSLRSNKLNHQLNGVSTEAVPTLSLPSPFESAWRQVHGAEPSFTNYTASFKGCLDYVMLSGNIKAVSTNTLPSAGELLTETALPNSRWPSDHVPLVVDLDLS